MKNKNIKKNLINFFNNIFAILITYAIFIGIIVCIMFIVSIIIGGDIGTKIAIKSEKLMMTAIPTSALGAIMALIGFYLGNTHSLTIESNKDNKE